MTIWLCRADLSDYCPRLSHTGLIQSDSGVSVKQVTPIPNEITACSFCRLVGDMDVPKLLRNMSFDLPVCDDTKLIPAGLLK